MRLLALGRCLAEAHYCATEGASQDDVCIPKARDSALQTLCVGTRCVVPSVLADGLLVLDDPIPMAFMDHSSHEGNRRQWGDIIAIRMMRIGHVPSHF